MGESKTLNVPKYLDESAHFLAEFSWMYDFRNVDLFVVDALNIISPEWISILSQLTTEELRKIPFGFIKDDWPECLKAFLQKAIELSEVRFMPRLLTESIDDIIVPDYISQKTPLKKLLEIMWMSAGLGKLIKEYACSTILDFGSGLGYLDNILRYNFGVKVIGFENIEERVHVANNRIQKNDCTTCIHHINRKIEDDADCCELIQSKLHESWRHPNCSSPRTQISLNDDKKNAIMVGLHSCGNLMPNMMRLFTKLPEIKVFLSVGCCYHFINLNGFPMSKSAKRALDSVAAKFSNWKPSVPGLRLGCQNTRAHWENLSEEDQRFNDKCLFYRVVLEMLVQKENITWKKPKRRHRKQDVESPETFLKFAFQNHLESALHKEISNKFLELCEEKEILFPYLRIFRLLQTLIQPIWEGFIIMDRLAYFQENNIHSELFLLCDEKISPRNILLCAIK